MQVRALHYLHSNRIIHRDMKPQNILIGSGSIVKVGLTVFSHEETCTRHFLLFVALEFFQHLLLWFSYIIHRVKTSFNLIQFFCKHTSSMKALHKCLVHLFREIIFFFQSSLRKLYQNVCFKYSEDIFRNIWVGNVYSHVCYKAAKYLFVWVWKILRIEITSTFLWFYSHERGWEKKDSHEEMNFV